ncbi:hypothetical protein LSCM1_01274 [Leishmania martiniquensis]|uniref:Methyltransferase type 11 domain-containing protein n=1 Tax=Leishmania martiniquensis TaxID=1580590 RepID=A0A836KIP5_9TRYP|nr:hypothetical protein LSCM1_01274 [Leishmania martiniquensis]
MHNDARELNPGRADFWEHFYDQEGGRLQKKEQHHRKAREIAARGSLMNHYEWFMEYPRYEAALKAALRTAPTALSCDGPTRVLHVGCGNSDFCDHVEELLLDLGAVPSSSSRASEVLNIDICQNIIAHLALSFPSRRYAVGNCCDLHVSSSPFVPSSRDGAWYKVDTALQLRTVLQNSANIVFDKGTADALLSAFAGDYNPNMEAYMCEMLKVLRLGSLLFLISINSEDVVSPYVLAAEDRLKSFRLEYRDVIELAGQDLRHLRVETLGSRYNCYGFVVVTSAAAEQK